MAGRVTLCELKRRFDYDRECDVWTYVVRAGGIVPGSVAAKPPANPNDYRSIFIAGRRYLAHRLVWLWCVGDWPSGEIDHVNGNRHDNRIENLRVVTRQQNAWNQRPHRRTKSGLTGAVQYGDGDRWLAMISVAGKRVRLGVFDTPEEANEAYRLAAKEIFGRFAYRGGETT